MKLTQNSLKNPAALAVITAILMLLGVFSIFKLPAQLLPNLNKPIMSIINIWPGASPSEMESEIGVPIEEVLQGTPGMTNMDLYNMGNMGFMQLEFSLKTDMTRAMMEVISRLNRIRSLPASAQRPQIMMGEWGDANDTLIEYFIRQTPGAEGDIKDQAKYVRDIILPDLQMLPGVSRIDLDDGSDGQGEQLQIIFDVYKAAELGIDIARVPARVGRSLDVSGGFVDVGRKQYTVRFEGKYEAEELSNSILEWRNGLPIKLGDIARVEIAYGRRDGFIYQNGQPAFRMSLVKDNDANVLEALGNVKIKIAELNETVFKERGLVAQYSFDPGQYINNSITLLGSNMLIGMFLAIGVLWLFLRQWRATFLIALAIPISLLVTFLVLNFAGRSLNVISLAGLAFATGMVLDAAIVVLENIVRLRERGETPRDASDLGATQVWGALLASTATTVAIFIPIMFLEDAEGQMFADLALTIAIGVSVSLLVAVTILPTTARYWMRQLPEPKLGETTWDRLSAKLMTLTNSKVKRASWVSSLIVFSIVTTVALWPESNYLPPVKRDTVDAFMQFPPSANVETSDKEIAQKLTERLEPYLTGEKQPQIRDYFLWTFPGGTGGMLGLNAVEGTDLDAFERLVNREIISGFPDVTGFGFRRSLFGGFSDANSVELEITSNNLEAVRLASIQAQGIIMGTIPGSFAVSPFMDPSVQSIQLSFSPNDARLAEVGWSRQDLTMVILELGQGAWLGEYFDGQEKLNIYLRAEGFESTEEMANIPVQTPKGGVVPLGELATAKEILGPNGIARFNRKRGYQLTVNPPKGMSLEVLVAELKEKVEPEILASLPADGRVFYGGSAEDLERALGTLALNFVMAFVLLILIMAALFKSLKDALLVIISIPMAAVGGVLALNIMNAIKFQPLDLLGMIGFIILLGLVVNNAILLVAQTRKGEDRGLDRIEAVHQALRLRLRPIFMSTLTSLFGMLPLLMVPGSGSEIYRGMAAAIVGGMSVSTIFTLILLPCLLQMGTARKRAPSLDDKYKTEPSAAE